MRSAFSSILLFFLLLIPDLLVTSCTSTRYIESVRVETRFDSVYLTDSIYIKDSIRIEIRGDSCLIDHSHFEKETTEKGSVRVDTLTQTDSLYIYKEQPLNGWQQFRLNTWWGLIIILVIIIIIDIYIFRKKKK